jgi:hypothetical protein
MKRIGVFGEKYDGYGWCFGFDKGEEVYKIPSRGLHYSYEFT